jgi:hypothetical protein
MDDQYRLAWADIEGSVTTLKVPQKRHRQATVHNIGA